MGHPVKLLYTATENCKNISGLDKVATTTNGGNANLLYWPASISIWRRTGWRNRQQFWLAVYRVIQIRQLWGFTYWK